ncbi:MAG: response regulator, partial [Gammaproteobacteria bacterium]|nr:response regulator [Gammaproteobacteria bacterium]
MNMEAETHTMIIDSVITMTAIDVFIITLTLFACWIFYKYRHPLKQLQLNRALFLCLSGLATIAVFYFADLYTMYVMPLYMPMSEAMNNMRALHLEYQWVLAMVCVSLIVIGLIDLMSNLLPKTNNMVNELRANRQVLKMHASELQHAIREAENANRSKSFFLANMSHEIRTPLTSILGYSHLMHEHDKLNDELKEDLDNIISSSEHLQQIVNDILDVSKIEAGQLTIEKTRISPTQIAHDISKFATPLIKNNEVTFSLDLLYPLPLNIHSDSVRLKQILFNLCGNAIKFTHQGNIRLEVSYEENNRLLEYRIIDTGIGLDEKESLQLFKPFTQADISTTRKYGGSGLGLYISQQLAHKLDGEIVIESKKGKGSTFTLRLHLDPAAALELTHGEEISQIVSSNHEHINKLRGRILLAEDNKVNQLLISKYLRKAGLSIDVAENGQLAIEFAQKNTYDLIFMDVQMPIMGGIEATQFLRKNGYTVPIIFLSANTSREDIQLSYDAGCNDYLTKPINNTRFYQVLDKFL